VIGLPMINGAEGQHMHNPYFPVPYAAGMLQGAADTEFPQLTPQLTLADGSVLMPLSWFQDVRMERRGDRTILRWRMDALDRMGGKDAAADRRVQVTTRYVFAPGRITRTDTYRAASPVALRGVTMAFASFSGQPRVTGQRVAFGAGEVTGFAAKGFDRCDAMPAEGGTYRANTGAFGTRVACTLGPRELRRPLTVGWTLTYR
jgi:hypothetical protein